MAMGETVTIYMQHSLNDHSKIHMQHSINDHSKTHM